MYTEAQRSKLAKVIDYIRKAGWTDDYVVIQNLVAHLEKEGGELFQEFKSFLGSYDSVKARAFFCKFPKLVTDKKGYYNEIKLFSAWEAFDSASA